MKLTLPPTALGDTFHFRASALPQRVAPTAATTPAHLPGAPGGSEPERGGADVGIPAPAPAPAGALVETERGWAALDRFAVRERSERLAAALRAVEPQLSDFEVMPPAGPLFLSHRFSAISGSRLW